MSQTREILGDLVNYEEVTAIRPLDPPAIEKGEIPRYIHCPLFQKAQAKIDSAMERHTLRVKQAEERVKQSQEQIASLEGVIEGWEKEARGVSLVNRLTLDRSSASSVERYNRDVARHNEAVEQVRRYQDRLDNAIDRHNDLVQRHNEAVAEAQERLDELNLQALGEIDDDLVVFLDCCSQMVARLSDSEAPSEQEAALETCFIGLKIYHSFGEYIDAPAARQQARQYLSVLDRQFLELGSSSGVMSALRDLFRRNRSLMETNAGLYSQMADTVGSVNQQEMESMVRSLETRFNESFRTEFHYQGVVDPARLQSIMNEMHQSVQAVNRNVEQVKETVSHTKPVAEAGATAQQRLEILLSQMRANVRAMQGQLLGPRHFVRDLIDPAVIEGFYTREERDAAVSVRQGLLESLGEDVVMGVLREGSDPYALARGEQLIKDAGLLRLVSNPWDPGRSIFVDLPDLPRKARAKTERPLFAVAVRLAASSPAILGRLQGAFLSQLESGENGLVPIGDRYPVDAVLGRFTRSEGMLLALPELAALVHLPNPALVSQGLEVAEKGAPPPRLAVERILCPLGSNDYRGAERPVGIPADQLTRHLAILGGTGSGKTNLMKVAFSPLLEQGYGMAVLDPKGDLAQGFLDLVPQHRINDVIWFDPTDREYPPALNILQASGDLSPDELAGELMIGLKRIFTGSSEFGPRMEWILRMAVRTLLDSEGEKTLYDVRRFLEEASFRTRVLGSVKDQRLRRFWQGRNLSHNIIDPLLNRLSTFLDRPSIRDVVCQPNRIDFHQVMREGKIFIANLEKGRLQEAAYILGSFILSRLQLAALARRTGERKLFPVLVDEFHNFAGHGLDTESIETFLSETRSYQAPLVVSTQYLGRLNRSVVAALFGNLGTQVCLNMGQADAQLLQRELGRFTAEDLLNLGIGHAIVRMGPARDTFNVRIPLAGKRESHRAAVIQQSRERYCRTSQEVADLLEEETEPQAPEHRTWIVDAQGTVFTSDRTQEYQDAKAAEGSVHMPAEPVREKADRKTGGQAHGATEPESRVDRKLMEYLEHTARSPFIPALQRDEMLKLSRYKGSLLRQRLTKLGWIRQHKANTGRRSGQLTLLEVTEAGYEFLASVKARVERPRGRGGFLHKYYAYKLKEYAEATWPSCDARIEDASQGRPADVTVRIPGPSQRVIALEIFMTGEAKEIRGIARDIELFDRVIVCAASPGALESLQARARDTLGEELLQKVEFHLISQYLMNEGPTGESGPAPVTSTTAPSPARRKTQPGKISYQKQKSSSEIEKSRPKSETEIENGPPPRKPGRRPRTPLLDQVEAAYLHLHDWEWLSECELANLPEVQERINHRQVMAEAQALRCLLFEAARQVIQDLDTVPDRVGVKGFLELHLEGRNVTAIARELGVTREWVSRSYRRETFRLAGMQFVRLVSRGP